MEKKCSDCVFAIIEDRGYSNWTVTGVELRCSKRLHPNDGFDLWYRKNKEDMFAETCEEFHSGEPVTIDVDGDDWSKEKGWSDYSNGFVNSEQIEETIRG